MIGEIAGHVWWLHTHSEFYDVYLQTDRAVYRCSLSDSAWREVDVSPDPCGFVFSAPLGKVIAKCRTGSDGCRYVFFTDGAGMRAFNPPDEPDRGITILSGAATYLSQSDCDHIFELNEEMPETPIIRAG